MCTVVPELRPTVKSRHHPPPTTIFSRLTPLRFSAACEIHRHRDPSLRVTTYWIWNIYRCPRKHFQRPSLSSQGSASHLATHHRHPRQKTLAYHHSQSVCLFVTLGQSVRPPPRVAQGIVPPVGTPAVVPIGEDCMVVAGHLVAGHLVVGRFVGD
jgi:hypothetical protein